MGGCFWTSQSRRLPLNGKPLTLSPMEYKMLNLFRKIPGKC